MKKMKYDHHEPTSLEELEKTLKYNACKHILVKEGWHEFMAKFHGFEDEVTLRFAQGFDGKVTRIGDLTMKVNEKTIAQATGLPSEGIKWFKNKRVDKQQSMQFLKARHHDVNWVKGIPRSHTRDE